MTQSVKMRGAVIILYFAGFLIKASSENAAHEMQPKIIGGHPIDIKSRPFMLSLHTSKGFLCGASIISRTLAITALHCLRKSVQFYVRAGSNKTDKDGHMHKVTNIHVYNDTYDHFSQLFYHDIALLEVTPPFHFSKTVRPIHLPKSTYGVQRQLLVCGWGSTKSQKEKIPKALMGVSVEYVPFEICSSYYVSIKNDYHLCYGTRGKDACFGDSGGPLASIERKPK
ncbi:hypodermin-B isoform X2 [Polyergus mexicanus]|uniref:hypodermin-B isoform X2 n=1 Tax=Polyergus mexicanus TaxID=615972 RepID=UPI0038B480F4